MSKDNNLIPSNGWQRDFSSDQRDARSSISKFGKVKAHRRQGLSTTHEKVRTNTLTPNNRMALSNTQNIWSDGNSNNQTHASATVDIQKPQGIEVFKKRTISIGITDPSLVYPANKNGIFPTLASGHAHMTILADGNNTGQINEIK